VQKTAVQTTKIAAQNAATLAQAKPMAPKRAAPPTPRPDTRPMSSAEVRAKIDADMDRAWREHTRR
jgi:hypothetical protein